MNKTVFITGAAKRIGKAIALTFKDLGWNIIIHYNSSKKDADELANKINKDNPDTARTVQGDLDKEADITKILNDIDDIFPSLDLLVNNASTFYPTPIEEISDDHWEKLIGSNLKGPLFLIQGLKDKLKASNGSIINITSLGAELGFPNNPSYQMSKAGLRQLTKALARDWGEFGIRANNICPGYIKTAMTIKSFNNSKLNNQRSDNTLLKRWGEPT